MGININCFAFFHVIISHSTDIILKIARSKQWFLIRSYDPRQYLCVHHYYIKVSIGYQLRFLLRLLSQE